MPTRRTALIVTLAIVAFGLVLGAVVFRDRVAEPTLAEIAPVLDSSIEATVEAPVADTTGQEEATAGVFQARRLDVADPPASQYEDYLAARPKTILDLQPFREASSVRIENPAGGQGEATLVNLNPYVNAWFLLRIDWRGRDPVYYHLENSHPEEQRIELDPKYLHGLALVSSQETRYCSVWGETESELEAARASRLTNAPVCQGAVFLRNPTEGRMTAKEWVTGFLRDRVPQGEKITVFVREQFFQDAFLATSDLVSAPAANGARPRAAGAPRRPLIDPRYEANYLVPAELGLHLDNGPDNQVLVGQWYPVKDNPGIFVSTIEPRLVDAELINSLQGQLNPLDDIEESALVFMTAFDLEEFDVGFALGTEHPRVVWSERVPPSMVDDSLPGPDGIATVEPLVMTGMLSPEEASRAAATFTGGFKRSHGAFKWSELATRNGGSHYGFIEAGTILSKLQPGLATVLVYADGQVDLKTWTDEDVHELPRIRHARQNGVPIIDYDAATGTSRPGAQVKQWTLGNWSGSQDQRFRTLRAGLCLQEHEGERFLIYGYFSSATPSAMARVFQAYHCRYAMLLDMNALEHTYLALYRQRDSRFLIQHLIKGMEVLDKSIEGQDLPRFVGFADNRDFFYLSRRSDP